MDRLFGFGALRNIAAAAPAPGMWVLLQRWKRIRCSDRCDSRADLAYLVLSREFVSFFRALRGSSEGSDG